jgi:hypothetical protein
VRPWEGLCIAEGVNRGVIGCGTQAKAVEIAAGAGQWLKCRTEDGAKAYGVPSQCQAGRYYLVTCESCDCPDLQRNGLSGSRIGHAGIHTPCKHVLAVRLHCELVKARQRPRRPRRGRLTVVRSAAPAPSDDVFSRFDRD